MEETPALSLYEASDEDSSPRSMAAARRPASKSPEGKGLLTRKDKHGGKLGAGEASGQLQLQGVQHLYVEDLAEEALSRPRPRKTVSNTKGQMALKRWRSKATRSASFDSTTNPGCVLAESAAISGDRSASIERSDPSRDELCEFSFDIPSQGRDTCDDQASSSGSNPCDASGCALDSTKLGSRLVIEVLDDPVEGAPGAESCNARDCAELDLKGEAALCESRGLAHVRRGKARGAHDRSKSQGDLMSSGLRLMPSDLKWGARSASAAHSHGKGAAIEASEGLCACDPLDAYDRSSDSHPSIDTLESYQQYLQSLYRKFGEQDGAILQPSALDEAGINETEKELTAAGCMTSAPEPAASSDVPSSQQGCTAEPQCNRREALVDVGQGTSGNIETVRRKGPAVSCQGDNLLKFALLNACNTKGAAPLEHGAPLVHN